MYKKKCLTKKNIEQNIVNVNNKNGIAVERWTPDGISLNLKLN